MEVRRSVWAAFPAFLLEVEGFLEEQFVKRLYLKCKPQ